LANSTSAADGPVKSSTTLSAALQSLANLLPELLNYILNLYTRAANITEEALPQLAFSETVIRFSKLLSFCHLRDGYIDEHLLNHIVLNKPLSSSDMADRPRGGAYLRKTELTNRLFRALPTSTDDALLSRDVCPILVAMASILSTLGLHRKKAFVLRELIATLISALLHARKIGAAEMGIHPAAGLSAVEGAGLALRPVDAGSTGVQRGLDVLMRSLGDIYGIVGLETPRNDGPEMNGTSSEDHDVELSWDSNEQIMTRTLRNSRLRRFGMLTLKVDLLVACVNLCEALPNFQGVLHFTVELLQTIGPGIPLPPDGGTRMQSLPRDEQIRLINNIKRTVGAGNKLGLKDLEAEYWDDFLVRGVELPDQPPSKKLFPHSSTDLKVAEAIQDSGKKNPFIYNPFTKTANAAIDHVVVSGDSTIFKVDLQNPFEFELEIEKLTLETEGALFESGSQTLVIAPYCMHTVNLVGLAKETGSLKVTGCRIKVKDCRERRFPIFKNVWKPKLDVKSKMTGLAARQGKLDRPISTGSEGSQEKTVITGKSPEFDTLVTTVINPQPTLVVNSGSLPQSAVMLLEGETKTFSVTLQNTSSTTPVDFLLFSFKDSTTGKLESAMSNKDIPPAELYELELQLSKKALRWIRGDQHQEVLIGPGQATTLNVEIFGIPGLTEATMQIDYGFLGVPKSETKEKFYTRQIILPLTVTVNASVEMVKWDILPFTGYFAWNNQRKQQHLSNGTIPTPNDPSSRSRAISRSSRQEDRKEGNNQFQSLLDRLGLRSHGDDHSLLLLDLRNAWPSPLSISIQVRDTTTLSQSPGGIDPWRRAYTVHEILQPGHVSRLVLLVPRMFLSNLHAPIPPLNPASRRQYVVSATKIPAEQELANREAFWFRAELLKHVRGTWSEDSTSREGTIELRGIRLNARMLDAMRIEDMDVSFSLSRTAPSGSDLSVRQTSRSSFTVQTETFLTLNTTILNRGSHPIHPLLRLQPSLRNQPQPTALDLSKRLVWTGMLQRALPILGPGETTEVTLGLCAMCRGEFEISGSVEELRVLKREGSPDEEGLDALALKEREKGRRIWYAREGCVIVARDGNNVMGSEYDS
jgi:trafficking protein particle complex subunit 9